jgi:hypothetical protein
MADQLSLEFGRTETRTTVVNVHTDPFDIYIGRSGKGVTSIWGNPFTTGRDGTREMVIEKYRAYLQGRPDLLALIPTLKGKRLGCFCKRHDREVACHGDVLAELADREGG